tara:strand:+ start:4380 stop:4667 length:288 start_codon:yes stop_codon:yes gene_type:complete
LQSVATGEIPDVRTVHATQTVVHPTVAQLLIVIALARSKMSTWSSGHGKFLKKDPDHGSWARKIKHWFCKVGLCNLDKCKCGCHKCCGNPSCKCK